MSDAKKLPRPPQVSLAGWVTIVGSLFVVFNAFEVVGGLRSLDNRESLTETLSKEPFKGAGVTLEQAISFMHGAALVAGGCAAAAAILGWFVMQREKSARLALSIVAVPLFLSGLIAGGFLSSMVAVAAVLLWTKPSRDWFNGIAAKPVERRTPPRSEPVASGHHTQTPPDPSSPAPHGEPSDEPRPYRGFGESTAPGEQPRPDQGLQSWSGEHGPQPDHAAQSEASPRPPEVLRAGLATWITTALVAIGASLAVIGFAAYPDLVRDMYEQESRFRDADLSLGQVRTATMVMAGLFILWSLSAASLAVLAFKGHEWARVLLIISAAFAGLLSLVMVVASPPLIAVAVACGYAIYALTRSTVTPWFREKTQARKAR